MVPEFELGHNTAEAIKNISCMKSENAVIRWFKKFRSSCKNVDDQAWSGRHKSVDSEAVLQDNDTNLVSSTGRVLGELGILTVSAKVFAAVEFCLMYY